MLCVTTVASSYLSFLATAIDYKLDLIPYYNPGTLLIASHVVDA